MNNFTNAGANITRIHIFNGVPYVKRGGLYYKITTEDVYRENYVWLTCKPEKYLE